MQTLDVSNCHKLEGLSCELNEITEINVTGCSKLTDLRCNQNQLTSIDLSTCSNLEYLYAFDNQITTIDLSTCPLLIWVQVENNQLESIDISNNDLIQRLHIYNNKLETIDISHCKKLTYLMIANNEISSLDLTNKEWITVLDCRNNKFTFSTLLSSNENWFAYKYSPQQHIKLPANSNYTIDLSTESTIDGSETIYTWKTKTGDLLTPDIDYSIENGVTTFLKFPTDSVYCELTNSVFPDLHGDSVLCTTKTFITKETSNTNDFITMNNPVIFSSGNTIIIKNCENWAIEIFDLQGCKLYEIYATTNNVCYSVKNQ